MENQPSVEAGSRGFSFVFDGALGLGTLLVNKIIPSLKIPSVELIVVDIFAVWKQQFLPLCFAQG